MAKLTSKQRKDIPKRDFAIPSKAPGSGSYPINDASHARNALARVSQHGSPARKAEVRAKVHAKYQGIGEKSPTKSGAGSDDRRPSKSPHLRGPAPDNRQQSSQFRAPPSMKGGPKPPPSIARSSARPGESSGKASSNAAAGRGSHDGGSGIDRAMSAQADREHPRK